MARTPDPPPEAGPSKPPPKQAPERSPTDSEPESEPTDAEWSDEEFEVDAIKWAKYMDSRRTRPDGWKGWHYGVMWRNYLKSGSDTVEGLAQFRDANENVPLVKEFWRALGKKALRDEPLGRTGEEHLCPDELMARRMKEANPRRNFAAFKRRQKTEALGLPTRKGDSDYYLRKKRIAEKAKRKAEEEAGSRPPADKGKSADKGKGKEKAKGAENKKAGSRPKWKRRVDSDDDSSDDEPLSAAAPLAANSKLRGKEPKRKASTDADKSPPKAKTASKAKDPPQAMPPPPVPAPKPAAPEQPSRGSPAPSFDSLFDDDGPASQGTPRKRRRVTSPPRTTASPAAAPKGTAASTSTRKSASPSKGGSNVFEADPGVFGPDPVVFDVPSSPVEEAATPAPVDAPTPLFAPGPSQYDAPTPLFDGGDADDAMDAVDALLSPHVGTADVKPSMSTGETSARAPAKPPSRGSSPIVIDSPEPESTPATTNALAPPDLVVISATPGNSQVSRAPSSSPPVSPGRKLSVPGTASLNQHNSTTAATTSPPAPDSEQPNAVPDPSPQSSPPVPLASLPRKPSSATENREPQVEKPAEKLPPSQRPRFVQPKRIVTIDTPVDTSKFKSLKGMSFKKNAGSSPTGPASAGPSSVGTATSGSSAGPLSAGSGGGRSWAPEPTIGLRQTGAGQPSYSGIHGLPARPPPAGPGDTVHPSRRPFVPPAVGSRTGNRSQGPSNGAPGYGAGNNSSYVAGGRSPYGGGGRSPYNGNRSPYAGNMSPLDGNRSPGAGQAANGNKSPVWVGSGGVSPVIHQGGVSPQWGNQPLGPVHQFQPLRQAAQQMQQPVQPPMPQVPSSAYEAEKDPRRRARMAQATPQPPPGAPPPPPAESPIHPALKPVCSAQICLAEPQRGAKPLVVTLLPGGTNAPHHTYLLSRLPELSKLPERADCGPPLFAAQDYRCVNLVLAQGGSISEWCQVGPAPGNTPEQKGAWANVAQYMVQREKIYLSSDELVPTWPINTRDFVMFAVAGHLDLSKIPSAIKPVKNQILALVLSIPLHVHQVPVLPNPVRPDFTVGELKSKEPAELPFRPHNLADSYGIDGDWLGKLKGSIQIYPSLKNELYKDTLANLKKSGVKPPNGPESADDILLYNCHMGQIVRSGSMSKALEDNSRFYIVGPDLTLPADQWLLHPVWETGGLVTFSPTLILWDPAKFKEIMDLVSNTKNWAAYVHPTTLMWCQESWGDKKRCRDPAAAYETFTSALFTEDRLRKLAGSLPPDAAGLAVSYAPPPLQRKVDCTKWLSWLRRVFECSTYDELVPVCKEGHETQQAQLYPRLPDGDAMKLTSVEETGLRDLVSMRERPDLLPYRRYIYVGPLSKNPVDLIRPIEHVQYDNFAAVLSGAI